ncbi:MAG: tetratricopeptide repeat protein [Desulfobacterales bacterium]|nr:MAG: tetratricopeptide repeat protein [Desulfobacterales bacterium]
MELFGSVSPDNLFVNAIQQQSQLETLANQALSNGIDLYMQKKYEDAAGQFEKSVNLAPSSPYTADATKYLAQIYLKLNRTDKAISAYKRGIELNRDRDDLRVSLGNLYYAEERYGEALAEYKEAVRINPAANNHYSAGQGYLKLQKFSEAETAFRTVLRMEPNGPYGHYGLGQTYSKQGKYEKAIEQFETAVRKKGDFYEAYAEIGYARADLGEMEKAQEMVEFLEEHDTDLAETLSLYLNKVEPPKIMFAWGSSTFRSRLSINTPVSALDSYLENAGAAKAMTMKFQFNKDMDRASVENRLHWTISRASGWGAGKAYNFGLPIPSTEITLPSFPDHVLYDAESRTATVSFTVRQNETADGTIDPSHIVFKFDGQDAEGIAMDLDQDEFSGFSGVA